MYDFYADTSQFIDMALSLDIFSRSVAGSVHPYEDRVLIDHEKMLYAVADGVTISSRGSGGVAAELAIGFLREHFESDLLEAVKKTHERLINLKSEDQTIGETTLTAAHLKEGRAEVVNVGDSPAYLARDEILDPLFSEDRDARGYITQVIGSPEGVRPHLARRQVRACDYLLLASDGVAHVLTPIVIAPLVSKDIGARAFVETIIERAKKHPTGYDDDKSLTAIKILDV